MGIDILWHNQTLFKQPEVFDNAYLPESFDYRGGQLQALADCIAPCFKGMKPVSCRILGDTATGKTTSIKLVFHEAEQESKDVYLVHVNGSIFSNAFSIFSKIHKEIVGYEPPSSGVPMKEIYNKIFTKLEKKKGSLIVALDDAVYIEDLNKVVYDLLRNYEIFNVKTAVWLVGTPKDKFKVDEKTMSVFAGQNIIFPKYSEEEIFKILKKRSDFGLYSGVVSQEIIKKVANASMEKDLRFGIELLKSSVFEAESRGRKVVSLEDVDKVFGKFSGIKIEKEIEKDILGLLGKKNFNSGELFSELNKKNKLTYSSFYRTITELGKKKLIEMEDKPGDEGGRTREIRLGK